jgi:hypothetical protein
MVFTEVGILGVLLMWQWAAAATRVGVAGVR